MVHCKKTATPFVCGRKISDSYLPTLEPMGFRCGRCSNIWHISGGKQWVVSNSQGPSLKLELIILMMNLTLEVCWNATFDMSRVVHVWDMFASWWSCDWLVFRLNRNLLDLSVEPSSSVFLSSFQNFQMTHWGERWSINFSCQFWLDVTSCRQ